MNLRYFVVDVEGQLRRVPTTAAEAVWGGEADADDLDVVLGSELKLVTAVIDENLDPVMIFFLRVELDRGAITEESRLAAVEAITAGHGRRLSDPRQRRQFEGWPDDWRRQLAVALDAPAASFTKLGLGGPLALSDLWGVSLDTVMAYFEKAIG
ncbi:hypothetical protein [Alienimonas chondri]|uniref:Uncharacterized protein n=1 Tax=Alienimonas chondri TaxID=2681879 RepID=A0ABX1V8A4_9PLAN|nr:hypothetical protein [Alienimonas chondri]NNJ24049.1 hypothetical protein [Alienimonas chondri]